MTVLESRKRRHEEEAMDVEDEDETGVSVGPAPAKRKTTKPTLRDRELEEGEDFYLNLRDHWLLKNPHERNDVIPEIFDGHNIADFFDEDIEARLNELEEQEAALAEAGFYEDGNLEDPDDDDPKMQEMRSTAKK